MQMHVIAHPFLGKYALASLELSCGAGDNLWCRRRLCSWRRCVVLCCFAFCLALHCVVFCCSVAVMRACVYAYVCECGHACVCVYVCMRVGFLLELVPTHSRCHVFHYYV